MNGFFLFAAKKKRAQSKIAHKMELLQYNLNTMGKLFLTSQARGISPEEMFSYENHQDPPSLAFSGELNDGDKSAILDKLRENVSIVAEVPNYVRFQIIDGRCRVVIARYHIEQQSWLRLADLSNLKNPQIRIQTRKCYTSM